MCKQIGAANVVSPYSQKNLICCQKGRTTKCANSNVSRSSLFCHLSINKGHPDKILGAKAPALQ